MDDFKEKMKEKIKQYSNEQYLDGYIKKEFITKDGDADIFINVDEKYDLFDSWTIGEQVDLEKDVYDYIEEKTSMLGNNVPINLHIIGCEFTPHEQGIIKHILKEHYAIELYKVQQRYTQLKQKIFGLIVFGIACFLSYSILFFADNLNYLVEIFGFLFSFSLWEAMDCIIYSFSEVKDEREAVTQNLLINVDFSDSKVKEKEIKEDLQ
ncbi:MAG: hypothetical protein IKQ06_04455 [Bacilli bacterium]|nr:hypothetical protein [Bacilli bacterium]